MREKYYQHNETKAQFKLYTKISNGVIITTFDPGTGIGFGNRDLQIFVSDKELSTYYTEFKFKLISSNIMNDIISKYLGDIVYQFNNYGIEEEKARNLKEFVHHSPISLDLYRDMVKSEEDIEIGDYMVGDTDDYYYSDAEEFIPFLHKGIIPIIKKMMIELQASNEK